ncbi:hypothetical protein F2P56_007421, partial [Juglans regia]
TGGKPVAYPRVESFNSPKVASPSDPKEICCLPTRKRSPAIGLNARSNEKALDKTFVVPSIVPRDSLGGRDEANSGKESIAFARTKRGMLLKPAHVRRPSNGKFDVERLTETDESGSLSNVAKDLDGKDIKKNNFLPSQGPYIKLHDFFLKLFCNGSHIFHNVGLQVVRHFWERNDIKGAISALRKLPDHSVQADVTSVLMEKMEILTLDLFSCFLPVLLGLLDSKVERQANMSLEMLLKLVAAFGPVIHSTISAPPAVGVDLQAEQRLACCKQCFIQLQKIRKVLPALAR